MTRKELINSKEYFAGIIANTLWNLEGEKRVKHWDEVGGKIADVIMPVVEEIKKFESPALPSNPSFKRPTEERKWNEELNHWEPYAKAESQPTAVKAESSQWEIVNTSGEAGQDYINSINEKQSQPTAGGVKEEEIPSDITRKMMFEYRREIKQLKYDIESYKQRLESQPSPSNPSIKRPTEDALRDALVKHHVSMIEAGPAWYAGSELYNITEKALSIQPDKGEEKS